VAPGINVATTNEANAREINFFIVENPLQKN
jgi:hypothetical protein